MRRVFHLISGIVLAAATLFSVMPASADALSGSSFQPGRITDDIVFFNPNTMTVQQIQDFLVSKVPTCDSAGNNYYIGTYGGITYGAPGNSQGRPSIQRKNLDANYPAPYTCLRDYYENTTTHVNNIGSPGTIPDGGISSAQIIWNEAHNYNVNPQVLLVLIQKESLGPLLTDDWPWPTEYKAVTGYGCPDTPTGANCNSNYYGFYNQIHLAARQFRLYANSPSSYNYTIGANSILYHYPRVITVNGQSVDCGVAGVSIDNQATAGLYDYTPYVPNQAALNNLNGLGDACSAYGNRNFWAYFNNWFGPTLANDTVQTHPDGILISQDGRVYMVSNGTKRLVTTGTIFSSYGWPWWAVKPATTGDRGLPLGIPLDVINPGKLFRTASSSVYVMAWDASAQSWKKQLVTYNAFNTLGYKWSDVLTIPDAELPTATYATPLDGSVHPQGTFISTASDGRVWMVENNTLRYVSNGDILYSYGKTWSDIKPATTGDASLTVGADEPFQEGILLYSSGNLYAIDIPATGPSTKRPIGPWSCFSSILRFSLGETLTVPPSELPTTNGTNVSC